MNDVYVVQQPNSLTNHTDRYAVTLNSDFVNALNGGGTTEPHSTYTTAEEAREAALKLNKENM